MSNQPMPRRQELRPLVGDGHNKGGESRPEGGARCDGRAGPDTVSSDR